MARRSYGKKECALLPRERQFWIAPRGSEEENFPALVFLLFPRLLLGPLPAGILPGANHSIEVPANFRRLFEEFWGSAPGTIGVTVERSLFSYLTINPGEGNNSSFLRSASEFDSCRNLRTIVENIVFHGKQKPPSQQYKSCIWRLKRSLFFRTLSSYQESFIIATENDTFFH